MRAPIAILAFNRPIYFRKVLNSLKSQQGVELDDNDIALFQDGAVSEKTGRRYAEDAVIEENIQTFKDMFPNGHVFHSRVNLGVALNFEQAERYVFEERDAPVAFFLEDDLELGPCYLATMHKLAALAARREDIGHFAAYGDHHASIEQQEKRANSLMPLGHNWAFGLTKTQWNKSSLFVNQYLSLVREVDYRDRPTKEIIDLFHSWGCGAPGTSQDVAKTLACHLTGSVKVNTCAVFGRYIGERGLHTTPAFFDKHRFASTEVMCRQCFERNNMDEETFSILKDELAKYCASEMTPAHVGRGLEPELTDREKLELKKRLAASTACLEFGVGSSTTFVLDHSTGHVVSVNSDSNRITRLKQEAIVQRAITTGRLSFYHANIGGLKPGGQPKDDTSIRLWRNYYASPWTFRDHDYDVVLIDGHFRVMCALTAAVFVSPNTIVAIHDYFSRKNYFVLEKYFDTLVTVDRLAIMRRRSNINYKALVVDVTDHVFDAG